MAWVDKGPIRKTQTLLQNIGGSALLFYADSVIYLRAVKKCYKDAWFWGKDQTGIFRIKILNWHEWLKNIPGLLCLLIGLHNLHNMLGLYIQMAIKDNDIIVIIIKNNYNNK